MDAGIRNNTRGIDFAALGERAASREAASGSFPPGREARRLLVALRALMQAGGGEGAAWEWLADNRCLIEREARAAARGLASAGRLRAGRERVLVCAAALELARAGRGAVDCGAAREFFLGFQRRSPLSLAELDVLPDALRAALVWLLAEEFSGGSPDAEAVAAAVTSLREAASGGFDELAEGCDLCAMELGRDAAGVYARMDARSRALYRRALARLARREGMEELDCARRVLELAGAHAGDPKRGHVGWWLLCEPMGRPVRERTGRAACALALLAAAAASLGALVLCGGAAAALAFLPALELARRGLDAALLRALPPRELPSLELADGVPDEGRTVCAVSAVLASPSDGEALARRLEIFRCASRGCGGNLAFALLADLAEAKSESLETDAAVLGAAREAVDALNAKYGGGFFLFTRRRSENRRDGVWTPKERKRGALMALAALCAGRGSELAVLSGDRAWLGSARYILALDADTALLPGAARELIGAMLHPLNRPETDPARRCVSAGRGLLHPRVSVELAALDASRFAYLAGGPGGTDPYGGACGEAWMDLTGRGGFAGKGIIDIAALLECCDGLPENLVLSHDAVEGALLRGAYLGGTELTDGFPASPAGYFRRRHRWTRGDWQNLVVLRRLWRRLAPADRLRLLDSARRGLSAPAALAAISAWALAPGLYASGVLALLSLCPGLGGAVWHALTRPGGRERHPGSLPRGAALALCRALLRLGGLPWAAWTDLSAACTALYRALISRRRCLQWQPSALASGGGLPASLWPQAALGAALLFCAPEPAGKALGVIWLAAPALVPALGRPARRAAPLSEADRGFLLSECARIWRYFDEFCAPGRGYLPPDNFQEQPPAGAAERSSPTNIGLALTAALAALDLGLAGRERALELIGGILSSCEALEKWRGHLYNWYDLRSLRPLAPRYVSTVDSGNLAACLTALAAGLRELGEDGLADRAEALCRGMDFSALYDARRRLFRIGYDAEAGRLSPGCYDLMASEARLTGYFAVASGAVDARHWRRLSRALVGLDGRRGLASWTGTMFEYLMPELFLPLQHGSLLWESARFCLYAQRRDVPRSLPWGQSESAFFSLDASLAYRYKAHGCAALALQRGMDADTVCAPYAAFLALAVSPAAAVRDLRRFAALDGGGRWGLWEAIDFTPRRCAAGRGEVVRCVMAHHLGMSLAAAANALCGGVMQRRFMSGPDMAAFAPLLAERAPEGAAILRRRGFERPERPRERRAAVAADECECAGAALARAYPLSNGVYSLLLTAGGLSSAHAGGVELYRGFSSGAAGLRLSLRSGGETAGLLPAPLGAGWRCRLAGGLLRFTGEALGCGCALISGVFARDAAELRCVELEAPEGLEGELELSFEPVLARLDDYNAHPAYWRLGLCAAERGGALLISRLPRPGAAPCCLCLASDVKLELRANACGGALGWLSRPLVTARAAVSVPRGGRFAARFAIAFGAAEGPALEAARRCLAANAGQMADLASALGAVYGLGREALSGLPELAGRLLFPRAQGPGSRPDELWAAGVSGDYPIVSFRAGPGDGPGAAAAAARHALLRSCGVRADLVFLTSDGGDYHRRAAAAVSGALAEAGLDSLLGARGGIHCAGAEHAGAVEDCAAVRLAQDGSPLPPLSAAAPPPPGPSRRRGGRVEYAWDGGLFSFTVRGLLPERAWCLPLSNGRFGYLAADCGLGGMWAGNAREERVNAWLCDELAASGPETLEAASGGGTLSLFAAEDGVECRVSFGLGWARWEKLGCSVTAFVPREAAARVLIIENPPGEVRWHTALQLAAEARDSRFTVTELSGGLLRARNARSGMSFAAAFSAEAPVFTCDGAVWRAGEAPGRDGRGPGAVLRRGAAAPRQAGHRLRLLHGRGAAGPDVPRRGGGRAGARAGVLRRALPPL